MMNILKLRRSLNAVYPATLLIIAVFLVPSAYTQGGTSSAAVDEEALTKTIKEEIMRDLRDGDFLQEQIELGIQEFINKQREAKVAAHAERERLANEKAKNVRRVSLARDHIYGDPAAEITLIEYSDFECPYCQRFHTTAKEIVDSSDGKVNWVYRHFPLSFHNGAQKRAEASECANELGGNVAFWKYTDALYERAGANGKGVPLNELAALATEIGLDGQPFKECLDSGKYAARVAEDVTEGGEIGITGTPGNILLHNGTGEVILSAGAQPLSAFEAQISSMLQ